MQGIPSSTWEGIALDDLPIHLAAVAAAEYLELRSMFLWLALDDSVSPFQADLREACAPPIRLVTRGARWRDDDVVVPEVPRRTVELHEAELELLEGRAPRRVAGGVDELHALDEQLLHLARPVAGAPDAAPGVLGQRVRHRAAAHRPAVAHRPPIVVLRVEGQPDVLGEFAGHAVVGIVASGRLREGVVLGAADVHVALHVVAHPERGRGRHGQHLVRAARGAAVAAGLHAQRLLATVMHHGVQREVARPVTGRGVDLVDQRARQRRILEARAEESARRTIRRAAAAAARAGGGAARALATAGRAAAPGSAAAGRPAAGAASRAGHS